MPLLLRQPWTRSTPLRVRAPADARGGWGGGLQMFADYFSAKVIKVPGRLYPISLEYIPTEFDADGRPSAPTVQARRPSLSRVSLCKVTRYLPRRDWAAATAVDGRGSSSREVHVCECTIRTHAAFARVRMLADVLRASLSLSLSSRVQLLNALLPRRPGLGARCARRARDRAAPGCQAETH